MPKFSRRPSRADVDRALRDVATLWKPPDENERARGGPGADKTKHDGTYALNPTLGTLGPQEGST